MSLRSRPRDLVVVQKLVATTGKMGEDEWVKEGAPVEVRCNVYPATASENEALGLVNSQTRVVHIRNQPWPADQFSEVSYDGSYWEQIGPAVRYNKGVGTRHVQVYLRWLRDIP
jgi:hypothetical protein